MKTKSFSQFEKDFKRDVLVKVVICLRHGKTSRQRVTGLARLILEAFRQDAANIAFSKINKLSESYPEVLDIFIKRGYEYDEREKKEKLNQIVLYLKTKGGEN
jgi:hypothetical protein